MTKEINMQLNPGDVCVLRQDEQDIELVPAGTEVKLVSREADCWNCRGSINEVERPLLIFAHNLQKKEG